MRTGNSAAKPRVAAPVGNQCATLWRTVSRSNDDECDRQDATEKVERNGAIEDMPMEEGRRQHRVKRRRKVSANPQPVPAAKKRKKNSVKVDGDNQDGQIQEDKDSPRSNKWAIQRHRCNKWGHKQMQCQEEELICAENHYYSEWKRENRTERKDIRRCTQSAVPPKSSGS